MAEVYLLICANLPTLGGQTTLRRKADRGDAMIEYTVRVILELRPA